MAITPNDDIADSTILSSSNVDEFSLQLSQLLFSDHWAPRNTASHKVMLDVEDQLSTQELIFWLQLLLERINWKGSTSNQNTTWEHHTFATWIGPVEPFQLRADLIQVEDWIDAEIHVKFVDVEVRESHAQGIVREEGHENPVQDISNVCYLEGWDPHDEDSQHGEQP